MFYGWKLLDIWRMNMDILTTIPVRLNGPDSIAPLLENVRQRIVRRAYENFIERGAVYCHDLDTWLDAEPEYLASTDLQSRRPNCRGGKGSIKRCRRNAGAARSKTVPHCLR